MNSDGHDSEPPDWRPRLTPEMLGEVVAVLLPLFEERIERAAYAAMSAVLEEVREVVRREMRPKQVTVEYIAWRYSVSPSTVKRRRKTLGIPWRDAHGDIQPDDSKGEKRINIHEWEEQTRLSTRTVKHGLKAGGSTNLPASPESKRAKQ